MMREFRVTFGQKYRREEHPSLPEAHPDGWASVWASDGSDARRIVVDRLGIYWAFLYDTDDKGDWSYFPRGELATLNPEAKP